MGEFSQPLGKGSPPRRDGRDPAYFLCVKQDTAGSKVRAGRWEVREMGRKETGQCTDHLVDECSLAWTLPSPQGNELYILTSPRTFTLTSANTRFILRERPAETKVFSLTGSPLPPPRCSGTTWARCFQVQTPQPDWLRLGSVKKFCTLRPSFFSPFFLSKSFEFRAWLVRLMENWAALSCSKEQCSHSLAWHSSISPNVPSYRLLINASELFWNWKFKGFRFCLFLLQRADKSSLMLDCDSLWHLRQPRISLHGDAGPNSSPDLCLFPMIELYNFQKWHLKSHCILQCVNSLWNYWRFVPFHGEITVFKHFLALLIHGAQAAISAVPNPDEDRITSRGWGGWHKRCVVYQIVQQVCFSFFF